jgi:hypothetical protein
MRVLLKQLVIIKLVSKNKKQKIKTQSLPEPGWSRVWWVGAESLPKKKTENAQKEKRWAKAEMERRRCDFLGGGREIGEEGEREAERERWRRRIWRRIFLIQIRLVG